MLCVSHGYLQHLLVLQHHLDREVVVLAEELGLRPHLQQRVLELAAVLAEELVQLVVHDRALLAVVLEGSPVPLEVLDVRVLFQKPPGVRGDVVDHHADQDQVEVSWPRRLVEVGVQRRPDHEQAQADLDVDPEVVFLSVEVAQ